MNPSTVMYPVIIFLAALTAAMAFSIKTASHLDVLDGGEPQRTWQDASDYCEQLGNYRLPEIWELVGIHYGRNIALTDYTDYWSNTLAFDRGFGLNTRLGVLSYDILHDDDHFLCVR